jgi:RNA polymerase sigma-70 factor (family 1)
MTAADFTEMFDQYYGSMCLYANRLLGDKQKAEDITEEIFMRLWESGDLTKISNLRAYLYRAVKNQCLKSLSRPGPAIISLQQGEVSELCSIEAQDEVIRTEVLRQISIAMEKLPAPYSQIIQLSYVERLRNKDIATSLQMSLSSVERRKVKGLFILRGMLKTTQMLIAMLYL